MLAKFLANRTFNVKSALKKVEKEFEKCGIKLDFDLEKIDIPIVWDTTWGSPVYTKNDWYYSSITPLAKGYKIAVLGIDEKDWKPKGTAGFHKNIYNGVSGIEVKVKKEKVACGKDFLVWVISHEICHALFQLERIYLKKDRIDQTHNYLYKSNPKWQLKECLEHLDKQFIKTL